MRVYVGRMFVLLCVSIVFATALLRGGQEPVPTAASPLGETPSGRALLPESSRGSGHIGVRADWDRPLPRNLAAREVALRPSSGARQVGGGVHYNGPHYAASVEAGRAEWALPPARDDRFRPRWSFALDSIEAGGRSLLSAERGRPAVGADGASAVLVHGGVEEKYLFLEEALEQIFVVHALPAGGGEIRVAGRVGGNLEPPADGTRGQSLSFSHDGKEALTVSEGVAIDADGERLALDLEYERGVLALRVPADWVARARLPITIDPLIGSPVQIDSDAWLSYWIRTAFNPSTQRWLVVWNEHLGTGDDSNLLGRTIDVNGVLGPVLSLAADPALHEGVFELSYASNQNRFCLAYQARPASSSVTTRGIYAKLLNADGTPVSAAPITVASRPVTLYDGYTSPGVAYDGNRWFILWRYYSNGGPTDIEGRFLAANGTMSTTLVDLDASTGDPWGPYLAFSGGIYVIGWNESGSSGPVLLARTISPAGAVGPRMTLGSAPVNVLSGGGGRFLFLGITNQPPVGDQAGVVGVIVDAALAVQAGPFVVTEGFSGVAALDAAYSTPSNCWMTAVKTRYGMYDTPPAELRVHRVETDGTTYPGVLVASHYYPVNGAGLAAHSATTTVLSAFIEPANGTTPITAQFLDTAAPPPPPTPTGLKAVAGDSRVQLTWTATAGALHYNVLRGENGGPLVYIGQVSTPSFLDLDVINGTTYLYAISVQTPTGESAYGNAVSATPKAPGTVPALLVVGNTTLNTGDTAVRNRLQSLGYTVTVKAASSATSSDANGKAVVVVSSTVTASAVGTKYRNSGRPVVLWENVLYDSDYMKMTGTTAGTHYGTAASQTAVKIVLPSHPLAAGLTSGNKTVSTSSPFTWGKPGLSTGSQAIVAATLTTGDTARAAVFGYEKGATMVGMTAPARRVGLFLGDATAASLTTNGRKLFDAAIRWAAGVPTASPWSLTATANSGSVTLDWEAAAGATSYVIKRATSSSGPYTTIATGVTSTSYTDASLTNGTTYYYQVFALNAGGLGATPATTSAVPQASPIHVAVKGSRYLRKLPNDGLDPELWSEARYEAVVRRIVKKTINGVAQDVAEPVAFTSQWESLADPYATPGCLQVLDPTSNPCRLKATSTDGVALIRFTATIGTQKVYARFTVGVDDRLHPSIIFRFPEEDIAANRTQRVPPGYANHDLWAGNEGDTDLAARTRRSGARYAVASQFFDQTTKAWKQTGVQPYYLVEVPRGLKFNDGFNAAHEFVADQKVTINNRDYFFPSNAFEKVTPKNLKPYVNVYFVGKIRSSKSGVLAGVVQGGLDIAPHTLAMLVSDDASPTVVAHELGHCFAIRDLTLTSVIQSTLNNLTGVILDPPPNVQRSARRHLLMWGSDELLDTLILSDQADRVRVQLEFGKSNGFVDFWRD